MSSLDSIVVPTIAIAIGLFTGLPIDGVAVASASISDESVTTTQQEPIRPSMVGSASEDTTQLVGSVTDESGNPILTATVTVNGSHRTAETNNRGSYSLFLPAGTYEITVSAPGFEDETWVETLSAGHWSRTDVTLPYSPTVLDGTIETVAGKPIENATVGVIGSDASMSTDETGSYAFEVEPGTHWLRASADGYLTERTAVTAEENRTVTTTIQLTAVEAEPDEPDRSDVVTDELSRTDDSAGVQDAMDRREDVFDVFEDDTSGPNGPETTEAAAAVADRSTDGSGPPSTTEQLRGLAGFAATFLGTLIAATAVGLYRNRRQRS